MITLQMASIPEREKTFKIAFNSIHRQVYASRLILNGYSQRPSWIPRYVTTIETDNSLQDGSKFIDADKEFGYVIIADDDIAYPDDFVVTMINKLKHQYQNKAILTCMGKNLKPRPINHYYQDELEGFKTFETLNEDKRVEIPGTCAMVYHTSFVKIGAGQMHIPNADICVARYAKDNNIPCYTVAHDANWLTNLMPLLPLITPNIFDRYKNNHARLTDYVNQYL